MEEDDIVIRGGSTLGGKRERDEPIREEGVQA
jgi:hypothetical protein